MEYYGPPMTVAARVTIRGFHGFGNIDVPALESRDFKSAILDALWWEPASARSYLVLGNSSAEIIHVDLVFDSATRQHVDIPPYATLIEPFQYGPEDVSEDGHIASAHVTSSGSPGALRATGFSSSLSEHFFDTVRFVDPKLSTESALYANGLHFADSAVRLVVKNIGDSPITVSGKIYPLGHTQSIKPATIISASLGVGESGKLLLPASPERLEGAATRLESSGGPASMIAAFTSIEPTHRMARSVSFVDTSDYGALTGVYHWRIDGDLYFKCVGHQHRRIACGDRGIHPPKRRKRLQD